MTPNTAPLEFYRTLGRTGLKVSAFGLGGGAGISDDDAMHAYERGVNYFFFSTDLHHFQYRKMAATIRKLCGRGSAARDKVVLAAVTYVNRPHMYRSILFDQVQELGIEYIDILFWGCMCASDGDAMRICMDATPQLRGPNSGIARQFENFFSASSTLKKYGLIRNIGASFHDVNLATDWADSDLIDVSMLRYNVAHRSAAPVMERIHSHGAERQGVVSFKSIHDSSGPLRYPYNGVSERLAWPDPGTLYRYSLSNSKVDVCLAGWSNRTDVDHALDAFEKGALTEDEIRRLELFGDMHRGKRPFDESQLVLSQEAARAE